MKKFILATITLLVLTGGATAQSSSSGYVTTCSNCVTVVSGSCCAVSAAVSADETTLATWAAKKAVTAQLDWFDEAKIAKLDRVDLDAMKIRVDELCKWAKTLSNHIFASAYTDWGSNALSVIAKRRLTLDQLDVAKSLVGGLPTPPESK